MSKLESNPEIEPVGEQLRKAVWSDRPKCSVRGN